MRLPRVSLFRKNCIKELCLAVVSAVTPHRVKLAKLTARPRTTNLSCIAAVSGLRLDSGLSWGGRRV